MTRLESARNGVVAHVSQRSTIGNRKKLRDIHLTCVSVLVGCISSVCTAQPEAAILRVVTAGDSAFISRWNGTVESIHVADGNRQWSKRFHQKPIDVLAVSPGEASFGVSASEDREETANLVVWRKKDGEVARTKSIDLSPVTAVISQDGMHVLVGGYAGANGQFVRLAKDGKPQPVKGFDTSMVSRIAPADGANVIVGTETGEIAKVALDGTSTKVTAVAIKERIGRIEALCALPDNMVAAGTSSGCLALVDATTGEILFKREFSGGLGVREIRICGNTMIACVHDQLIVARIAARKFENAQSLKSRLGQINSFDVTPAHDAVIVGHNSGALSRLPFDSKNARFGTESEEQEIKIVTK